MCNNLNYFFTKHHQKSVITLHNASIRLFPASLSSFVAAAAAMDLGALVVVVVAVAEGGRLIVLGSMSCISRTITDISLSNRPSAW